MLRKIRLENYKSFKDFTVEFKKQKNSPNIYFIYGENGSGKSNLISSIKFLKDLSNSFSTLERISRYLSPESIHPKADINFLKSFVENLKHNHDIANMIKKNRRIGSKEPIKLEYTFELSNKEYIYEIVLGENRIIEESLKGPLNIDKVNIFNVSYNKELLININKSLFSNSYEKEIKELLNKYFGKHTLLSLIDNELNKKNFSYLKDNINNNIIELIKFILNISISYRDYDGTYTEDVLTQNNLPDSLVIGDIELEEEYKIVKAEELLKMYFKGLYSDFKDVYYKKTIYEQKLLYELFFKKMVGGELIDISIEFESSGTKKLLELFPYFINALEGGLVVIDEFETNIHDILISYVIERLNESDIKGQLIATTHNTRLLEELNINSFYILNVDDLGNKKIYNAKDSGFRVQKNHSLSQNYKKGAFGGIPIPGYFDFNDIKDFLKDNEDDKE